MTTASDWEGRVGRTWAMEHERTERAFAGIAMALDAAIGRVAPETGVVLDIGCGIGSTALALARAKPRLSLVGADLSDDLLAIARDRSSGGSNLSFVSGDAIAVATAHAPLDLIVSRHGVMFFPDPVAAFARLGTAARPGAPLVFSCFRARALNDWSTAVGAVLGIASTPPTGYAPGPYGLADERATAALLSEAGWRNIRAVPYDVRYLVGAGEDPATDALAFYRRIGSAASVLAAATPGERVRMERDILDMLRERTHGGEVAFMAAIWIWYAEATGEFA